MGRMGSWGGGCWIVGLALVGCSSQGESKATPPPGSGSDAGQDALVDVAADAARDGSTDGDGGVSCFPFTCVDRGAECGTALDGCGATIECGSCEEGESCGGGGPNRCGEEACTPSSCDDLGAVCGYASDGCSGVLNCGGCPAPWVCEGLGTANQCECVPTTCGQAGVECGTVPDGCGGVIDCGACPGGESCGGGGANLCGTGACNSKSCTQLGASCGWISDGCATAIECGSCEEPNTCGGGGDANQCGCLPKSCAQLGASCGMFDTGCGKVDCGGCTPPETCGGGGVSNACGCTCALPHAVTACEGGDCTLLACDSGWDNCDGVESNGCERSLSTTANCGTCGNACADGETCTNGACRCGNGSGCGSEQYCYAGQSCHDLPTMTWTPVCMNAGLEHLAPDYLYEFTIHGRPGATAEKYNRNVSCGDAAYVGESWTIPSSGWVGDKLESAPIGCFATIGEWETWAEVDGYETKHHFVTFYSTACSTAATCTQAKAYCHAK